LTKSTGKGKLNQTLTRATRPDYPLLSGGDVNLYSLFVERAMTVVQEAGFIGLIVPSGIASDKTAAKFFQGVATEGRLKALYDFENKKVFFPHVHASFKFCAFVASPSPTDGEARCAFYLHNVAELGDPNRCFELSAEDFARVNPNTGTAPVFISRRNAELTTRVYGNAPVLVDRSASEVVSQWPVKYATMFHMANDSYLFRTREELEEAEGAYLVGANEWESKDGKWLPLFQGRSVESYDHRFAGVDFNPENIRRGYVSVGTSEEQHTDPNFQIKFQYFIPEAELPSEVNQDFLIAYRRSTATTNSRTMVSAICPWTGYGDSLFLLLPSTATSKQEWGNTVSLLQANLMSIPFDFAARNKLQGQNFSWYILEQLPVIPPARYEDMHFGPKTAAEIVREAVLELTYTAHDIAPFARDMGYVDEAGIVKPPFTWDKERRLVQRAKLDAVFFHLYGITDRDDIRYIYSTFPIVEREEKAAYGGKYRSCELCLAYMNALAAGNPDAEIKL